MSHLQVRPIAARDTLLIRGAILRAGMPPDAARFEGDNDPATRHFGAFLDDQHIGVASLFRAAWPEDPELEPAWQLRGMATLPEARGLGAGRALLQACLDCAQQQSAAVFWCNARAPAVPFYRKHGLETIGDEFDIPTAGPHLRMWRRLP